MSTVLKKKISKASSEIKKARNDNVLLREIDPNEKKLHYVFYVGLDPIPVHEQNIGLATIKPFKLTSVDNWGSWTRDQDDKGSSGLRRHPDPKRKNEVYDTRGKEAGNNVEWLERCYSGKGLLAVRDLTGIEPETAITIVDSLLPEIPDDITYETAIQTINRNRNNAPKDLLKLQGKVADKLIEACEIAIAAGENELSSKKSEIQERHIPNGKGIPKLDKRAYGLIRLLGKSVADYENDTKAAGDAAAQQVGKAVAAMMPALQQPVQGLMSMEQIQQQATVVALALQQMGFAPVQVQGEAQPVSSIVPTKPDNKANTKPAQPTA